MDIDTYQEPVVYMRADCSVCRSEGFESQSWVQLVGNDRTLVATLNIVRGDGLLEDGGAGLSDVAWAMLGATAPCPIRVSHPEPIEAFRHVRAKLFRRALAPTELAAIVHDVATHRYSDVQLSAFLSACVGDRLANDEVVALTGAMVSAGQRLDWSSRLCSTSISSVACPTIAPHRSSSPL